MSQGKGTIYHEGNMTDSTPEKNSTILIVDDDSLIREMLTDALQEKGYIISSAENGKKALDKLSDSPHFDIVISDLNMPEMGGLELITKVRQKGNRTPIVVLTTVDETSTAIKAIKEGASDYLIKDENIPDTVVLSVSQILEKQRMLEEKRVADELINKQNKELAEANFLLQDLNQLKNKFLGMAAIDLRNPLLLIRSFSEALLDSSMGELNQSQSHYLKRIFTASKSMGDILNNLLDISKIESGKIQLDLNEEDLNELINNQVELNQIRANKKNIKLHTSFDEIPLVFLDRNAIIQIVDTFIGNAIKLSPSGGNIFINTELDGGNFRVSVIDEGPGISKKEQKALFSEFQTVDKGAGAGEKSTGLGLFIINKLVLLHKGKIDVTSEPGKGSTFFFTIPLKQ